MPASFVVINPNASKARSSSARAALRERLRSVLEHRDGSPPTILETSSQGETVPAVQAALASDVASVVGVGGDGTLREIAGALRGSGVPLGIIPAGTGNQVAAVLGIPLSLERAASALGAVRTRTIDLGEVTLSPETGPKRTGLFIIGCGAGFDAQLMATTPSSLKRKIGKSAYVAQAIKLAMAIDAVPCRITVDDKVVETDASIALIGNMGQLIPGVLGLRMPIDPGDGLLDLIAVAARGPIHGVKGLADQLLRTTLGGEHGSDSIRLRGERIIVEGERPAPLQVDGDYEGKGSLEARVIPAALDVLVPADGPYT